MTPHDVMHASPGDLVDVDVVGSGLHFVFVCGHVVPCINMPYQRGKSQKRRLCPVCGRKLAFKLYRCSDCHQVYVCSVKTYRKLYCDDCADARKGNSMQAAYYRRIGKPMPHQHAVRKEKYVPKQGPSRRGVSHPDCIHYESKCLPQAAFGLKSSVGCDGCPDYQPLERFAQVDDRPYNSFAVSPFPHVGCVS